MAEITTTKLNSAAGLGNKMVVTASCASIANADTWPTGLGTVEQVFVSNMTETQAVVSAKSGGTVTFTVTAGPIVNADLMAIGLP